MLRNILLPSILLILGYGFWISPDFKEIAAGVAIFLFGMLSLEEGFRSFTGGILERILKRTTNTLWKSLSFGVVSTTIMQSSSLVSVITISFLSAGLLGLTEGIGIIFGANIGTTTGAWLVAGLGLKVKISAYAMPMLVFGVILVFQRSSTLKGIGYVLAGLGFLFLGIHHMKEGFEAFKDTIDLAAYAIPGLLGLLIFTGIGIFATVVMQSSHATLVLIITALAAGQISYENALALAIGANIGTTITAILGAMSANEQGKRLAGAHLMFNVVTGLIAIVFIQQFMWAVEHVSAAVGIAVDDHALKLAVFHTIFNLVGVIVMVPFIGKMVTFLEGFIRPKETGRSEPRFLFGVSVDFPDTAVEAVRNETLHIYENALDLLTGGLSFTRAHLAPEVNLSDVVEKQSRALPYDMDSAYELKVKPIYSAIIAYISKASFTWKEEQSGDLHWLRDANRNIVEAIKGVKHLQKNMKRYIGSSNRHIRREYDQLRVNLAMILRELEVRRQHSEEDMAILSLDALRLVVEQNDKALNHRLYELIRDGLITPEMGSSLMNDSAYATEITHHLIAMGQSLFIAKDRDLTRAERTVLLDDNDLDQLRSSGQK